MHVCIGKKVLWVFANFVVLVTCLENAVKFACW